MSDFVSLPETLVKEFNLAPSAPRTSIETLYFVNHQLLAAFITKAASKQTYYTIRFLVDRDRVLDAYRAYAYFRWVDDMLDEQLSTNAERVAFLEQQQLLINGGYADEYPNNLNSEEHILTDLIRNNHHLDTGLELYVRNMMAVMAFDAERKGRLISQEELTAYSKHLSTAVAEALHYFIGHDDPTPHIPSRYLAVTGAHITHLLRDTVEDVAAGYFNIPCEFLDAHKLDPCDIKNPAYKTWVKSRVQLARDCFKVGKSYLAQITNWRCRLAGYAYIARFELVLNMIEQDSYQLRSDYSERKSLPSAFRMSEGILSMMLNGITRGQS